MTERSLEQVAPTPATLDTVRPLGTWGSHSPGRSVVDDQEGHDGRVYYSHLLDALRSR